MDAVSKAMCIQREQQREECPISSKWRTSFLKCKHMHTLVADIHLKVNYYH